MRTRTAFGPIAAAAGTGPAATGTKAGGSVGRAASGAGVGAGPCGAGVCPAQAQINKKAVQGARRCLIAPPFYQSPNLEADKSRPVEGEADVASTTARHPVPALPTFHLRETSRQHVSRNNWCVKRIEAIIGPLKLDGVKHRVLQLGARGMTISDIRQLGRHSGRRDNHHGSNGKLEFERKVDVQIVAADDVVERIVEAIVGISRAGRAADGTIIITTVADAIRIRTGERGSEAI
jgi:nitrogen regulatory protein P-II 1